MTQKTLTIINKLGLHARAAAKFVALTSRYASEIQLTRDDVTVDGKSIMGVMRLAANKGSSLTVTVEGEDEAAMLEAVEALIQNRFDEPE